jgi:hypothetical protein
MRHNTSVADGWNSRISVFSAEGDFVRHVGVGKLTFPSGVTCSAFGEFVVADTDAGQVVGFSASGEVLMVMPAGLCIGVAIHGSALICRVVHYPCRVNLDGAGELAVFT